MQEQIDFWLSIIDIILCIIDISLIVYLFFYKFPAEMKKKRFISWIHRKPSKKKFIGAKAATKKRG